MKVVIVMLKTKYERMSKEEKKEVVVNYKKTEAGRVMMMRLLRLIIIGLLGFLYSIYWLISHLSDLQWTDYLVIVPLTLISIFFIVMAFRLRKKVLNQFVIKKK